ncbi:MAG TPA: hypothetical protein VFB34_13265 [Chloroflexota bacterium]|nr:hypothetical protein [Chloroflexota bacterium]
MTASQPDIRLRRAEQSPESSPSGILCRVAPAVAPLLRSMARRTWSLPESHQSSGAVSQGAHDPFKILLRKRDLATLRIDWRLEAAGPMQLVEWDQSGRVLGPYLYRYQVYTVRPVFDDLGVHCGFGLNGRSLRPDQTVYMPVDARVDCALFIRSTDLRELLRGLESLTGSPRTEEGRPGLAPADAYFDLMQEINRTNYFLTWGYNEYMAPGWTAETLAPVLDNPAVRAVWLGLEG